MSNSTGLIPWSFKNDNLLLMSVEFWTTYYETMRRLHTAQGKPLTQPVKDRNLGTTDSKHVSCFERFWAVQLADALGVPRSEVGKRSIQFREYRSKSFDVCWPLKGDPRILISIKSMQNAYRNFTNRIEEGLGDSAVLRLYRSNAAFGFFFFMLDGNVPRGIAEQGKHLTKKTEDGRTTGVDPFLDLVEEGGDFFDLTEKAQYAKPPSQRASSKPSQRQDTIEKAAQSLLDLASAEPQFEPAIHYDSIAYMPTRFKNDDGVWLPTISTVDDRLNPSTFIERLIKTAEIRGLL